MGTGTWRNVTPGSAPSVSFIMLSSARHRSLVARKQPKGFCQSTEADAANMIDMVRRSGA